MFFGMPVLYGEAIRLEPLSEAHTDGLEEAALHDELWAWTTNRLRSRADVEAYMASALADAERGTTMPFATINEASGKVIGSTRFGNGDAANRRVEIGWTFLHPQYQRTRANTEAKYLMLRHAFTEMNCIRVELKTDALNMRSRAAILRLGATEEGILRSHMIVWNGRVRDTVYYSILQSEWPEVATRLEARLNR